MNEFFDELGRDLAAAAAARGATVEPAQLGSEVAAELLELARVTAHTRERRFAPLSCFLAGVAIERMRSTVPRLTDAEAASYVRDVRQALESRSAPE